jgi:hypothetical protein
MDWFRLFLAFIIMLIAFVIGCSIIGIIWYALWLIAWWLFPVLMCIFVWWGIYKLLIEKKK